MYYTLYVLYDGTWCTEFGDDDLDTVLEEAEEYDQPYAIVASHEAQPSHFIMEITK